MNKLALVAICLLLSSSSAFGECVALSKAIVKSDSQEEIISDLDLITSKQVAIFSASLRLNKITGRGSLGAVVKILADGIEIERMDLAIPNVQRSSVHRLPIMFLAEGPVGLTQYSVSFYMTGTHGDTAILDRARLCALE